MAYNYMIPLVGPLQPGYDCTIEKPVTQVGSMLVDGSACVTWRLRVIHNGDIRYETDQELVFEDGRLRGGAPEPFVWKIAQSEWDEDLGFYETDFVTKDGELSFSSNLQPAPYVVCSAPGKKNFFSNSGYRYASPPVIDQIAAYGRFVDVCPVVSIDRHRDQGQTIVMINPYSRDIIANIVASDGRRIPRIRVPSMSARSVRLEQLLDAQETEWHGRIQISANNRLLTVDVKHALSDPRQIADEEHLDPFRADPTHLPATQMFRQWFGRMLSMVRSRPSSGSPQS